MCAPQLASSSYNYQWLSADGVALLTGQQRGAHEARSGCQRGARGSQLAQGGLRLGRLTGQQAQAAAEQLIFYTAEEHGPGRRHHS